MIAHENELVARNIFPQSWTNSDGITYPRKWLADLSTAEQEVLGWYVIVDNMPTLDSDEEATAQPLVFNGSSITQNYTVSDIVVPVPTEVTMRQARLALLSQGHLTNAENALNGLSEPDRSAALIEWEYALSVDRNSTLVQTMITLLGLTTQEADDLFTLAASL